MENIANLLIITHVILGSIALISGTISIIAKKGNKLHKKSGKVFYYVLLISAFISLFVALMPNHKSPFLFCLGILSLYFIIGGYRSLKFNKENVSFLLDKIIALIIILLGVVMILYPILLNVKMNIVQLNFGFVSIIFGIIDLLLIRDLNKIKKKWLSIHLSKMISGYIATITAFIVNQFNFGIWRWFIPSIIGSIYIIYWLSKLNKKNAANRIS